MINEADKSFITNVPAKLRRKLFDLLIRKQGEVERKGLILRPGEEINLIKRRTLENYRGDGISEASDAVVEEAIEFYRRNY